MKMAHASTGRYIIVINKLFCGFSLLLVLSVGRAFASETIVVLTPVEASAGLRLEIPLKDKKATPMDVAIFTELSPVIVGETPVKLPDGQKPK